MGSQWAPVDPPLRASRIVASADGRTILVHAGCTVDAANSKKTCTIVRFIADAPTRYEFDATGCPDYAQVGVSPNGERAAVAGPCGLVRLPLAAPDGDPRRRSADEHEWIGDGPYALAIDDGGRVWTSAAAPIPTARVELCVRARPPSIEQRDAVTGEPIPDPSRSPCAGTELAATATSDGEGRFEAESLPLGNYVIAVELDGRWGTGQPAPMTMRAGMSGDLGKIPVAGLEP